MKRKIALAIIVLSVSFIAAANESFETVHHITVDGRTVGEFASSFAFMRSTRDIVNQIVAGYMLVEVKRFPNQAEQDYTIINDFGIDGAYFIIIQHNNVYEIRLYKQTDAVDASLRYFTAEHIGISLH